MNSAVLQRLVWKEYRVLRSFWLATVVLMIVASLAACWFGKWHLWGLRLNGEDFYFLAALGSCMYALGVGGMLFAIEHEMSTAAFLRRLPLDARHLVASKLAAAVISICSLKLVLWFVASLFWITAATSVDVGHVRNILASGLVTELEFFAWGALCSLLSRQPLTTIICGVAGPSIVLHILLPIVSQDSVGGVLGHYQTWMMIRSLFSLALLGLVAVLSEKWLRSPEPLSLQPSWMRRLTSRSHADHRLWLSAKLRAAPVRTTAWSQLGRMMWLQWRQSRVLWCSLAIPFLVSGAWNWFGTRVNNDGYMLFALCYGLLCLGLGVGMFRGQQAQSRFRYFAERGISPGRVWWGHQFLVLIPLTFAIAGYLLVFYHSMLPHISPENQSTDLSSFWRLTLLTAAVIFSTAQLAGMLFRNALVASAATLVALILQLIWFAFVNVWTHPDAESEFWIALLADVPFPLTWLCVSRWYAGHWILERKSRAVRWRLCVWLLAPWPLAACGIIGFRIFEIPGIGLEPPTRQQLLTLSAEEHQTAEMYQSVIAEIREPIRDPEIAERLRHSKDLINKITEASLRPVGALAGDPSQQRSKAELLFQLILIADSVARESNDFDTSLELCSTMMRVIHHWRQSTDCAGNMESQDLERRVLGLLRQRLATVTLKPEQYREAARRVAAWDKPFESYPRNFGWTYRDALNRVKEDWPPFLSTTIQQLEARGGTWMQWLPGEQTRALRQLRLEYAVALANPWIGDIREVGGLPINSVTMLGQRLRWKTHGIRSVVGDVFTHGVVFSSQSNDLRWVPISARKRLLRIWLEFHAFKAEHGEWPATSESLENQDPERDGVEFLPRGIWGAKAPRPLLVRGVNTDGFVVQGDEPCLVYFHAIKGHRMPLPSALIGAEEGEDRDLKSLSLIVELLDAPAKPQ